MSVVNGLSHPSNCYIVWTTWSGKVLLKVTDLLAGNQIKIKGKSLKKIKNVATTPVNC